MNSKISCMICEKKFHQITWTHLKTHNITMEDYRKKFPNVPIASEAYQERVSDGVRKAHKKPEYHRKIREGMKRWWVSRIPEERAEHRRKARENTTKYWANLTPEERTERGRIMSVKNPMKKLKYRRRVGKGVKRAHTNPDKYKIILISPEEQKKCYFCDELITKRGDCSKCLITHSLDGDHDNWAPENKVSVHHGCHSSYHNKERAKKGRKTNEQN